MVMPVMMTAAVRMTVVAVAMATRDVREIDGRDLLVRRVHDSPCVERVAAAGPAPPAAKHAETPAAGVDRGRQNCWRLQPAEYGTPRYRHRVMLIARSSPDLLPAKI